MNVLKNEAHVLTFGGDYIHLHGAVQLIFVGAVLDHLLVFNHLLESLPANEIVVLPVHLAGPHCPGCEWNSEIVKRHLNCISDRIVRRRRRQKFGKRKVALNPRVPCRLEYAVDSGFLLLCDGRGGRRGGRSSARIAIGKFCVHRRSVGDGEGNFRASGLDLVDDFVIFELEHVDAVYLENDVLLLEASSFSLFR